MNKVEKEEGVRPLLLNGILKEDQEEEGSTNPSPKRVFSRDSTSQRVIWHFFKYSICCIPNLH